MSQKEKKIWRAILLIGILITLVLAGFAMALDGIKGLVSEYCINVPRFPVEETPSKYGLEYQEIDVEVEPEILLKTWYIPSQLVEPLIILVPGYEGTRETVLPAIQFLNEAGYSTLAIDPRGQGESDGECICGSYLASDLGKIVQFFKQKGVSRFVLFGLSLGAVGSIIAGAQNQEVIGVIADSAFANIREGFRHSPSCEAKILFDNLLFYKLLQTFGPIYIHNAFGEFIDPTKATNALLHIKNVRNILLMHGKNDTVIPIENTYLLFDEAQKTPGIKELWIYEGDHGEGFKRYPTDYKKRVLDFLARVLEG